VRGRFGKRLLESYQGERAPHAWALITLAVNMGRLMMPQSPWQASLVQGAFRLARLVPSVQAYFAQMKYKPKPFYQVGFVLPGDGGMSLAGRMLPQPLLEFADRSRRMLDDVVGPEFALIAYGRDAQAAASQPELADLGVGTLRRLAVVPADVNPDPDRQNGESCDIETGRDVDGLLARFVPRGDDVVMLVRPDRYIAAAVRAWPSESMRLAAAIRALAAGTW